MRSSGISIEVLIEYVRLWQQGDSTQEMRRHLLVAERERLQSRISEMQTTLTRLNKKIAHYDDMIGTTCKML